MTKLKRAKLFVTKLDERAGESSDNIIGAIMAKLSIIDEFAVPQWYYYIIINSNIFNKYIHTIILPVFEL